MRRYHSKRWLDSPVTLEDMVREGKKAHGREVWFERQDDVSVDKERQVFDRVTCEFVSPQTFEARQAERAQIRRNQYPRGRRHGRHSGTFVSQAGL